jgi:hypothetical protein
MLASSRLRVVTNHFSFQVREVSEHMWGECKVGRNTMKFRSTNEVVILLSRLRGSDGLDHLYTQLVTTLYSSMLHTD